MLDAALLLKPDSPSVFPEMKLISLYHSQKGKQCGQWTFSSLEAENVGVVFIECLSTH